jgi:DNA-binding NarL/FixJ family response regulator
VGGDPVIVLVVDDAREVRRELARLLLAGGATVWEAGSLAEARLHLDASDGLRPDVVVADRHLPDGDGATLEAPGALLVLLTGDGPPYPRCAAACRKPVSLAAVAALVLDLARHQHDTDPLDEAVVNL